MSFGWSASDVVAALQLLHKVVVALKDTGGALSDYQDVSSFLSALSVTLQHLDALQSAPLDPDLAQNLSQLCKQVQRPLSSFCEDVRSSFERDLGVESARPKFLTTGRKLQWALSTSKKVKGLREKIGGPIAAIGIVLSQQVIQNTLQMPSEIQARIAHMIDIAIDTRISPRTLAIENEVKAISAAQSISSKLIRGTIRDAGNRTAAEIQTRSEEITLDLRSKFNTLSMSRKACVEGMMKIEDQSRTTLEAVQNCSVESRMASMNVQEMILDLFTKQSQSTDTVLRRVLQTGQETAHAIEMHSSASRDQAFSLHQKLDGMNWLMTAVNGRLGDLSMAQKSARLSKSSSEIEKAIDNIQRSVWLLVSALHVLIRELIYLLAPYLVAIYRASIQPLLLCGDHFLFEDAIGRQKSLPCFRFQHWENFYNLLIDTFQGEVGLSRVLNGQFMILNGFNEVPINKKAWRAGIQPKSRVTMAITLDTAAVRNGRCADPACPGQIVSGKNEFTRVCPTCGKHLSIWRDSTGGNEDFASEAAFSFEFGDDFPISSSKDPFDPNPRPSKIPSAPTKLHFPIKAVAKDITAFKRVIWLDSDESEVGEDIRYGGLEQLRPSAGKRSPHRARGVTTRKIPSLRTPKLNHSISDRQGTSAKASTKQTPDEMLYEFHVQLMPLGQINNGGLRGEYEDQARVTMSRLRSEFISRPMRPMKRQSSVSASKLVAHTPEP